MRNIKQAPAEKYVKEHQKRKWWQRCVSVLAAVSMFCMTYAMILPAVTWERSLVCEIPEHHHVDSCYETVTVPGEKELVCSETEHVHGPECYTISDKLTCGLEECEGHSHSETCYEKELVCQIPEHTHSDSCWAEAEPHEEKVLVCQLEEHEHTAACFDAPPEENDGYYCGQIEHVHSEEQYCYFSDGTLRCTIPEHQHTLACQSNPKEDVETAAAWEKTFANVSLTGNWADDVIAIAKTQIGYTESTQNYEVQEDGTTIKGYTRYGDWYGNAYGDWCAMFCSFCLHYAGVERNLMPFASSCEAWVRSLTEKELYHELDSGYEPKSGDLVFFNNDDDLYADHVGLVFEVHEDGLTTIEGNWNNFVCTVEHKLSDNTLLGYGELPENPNPTEMEASAGNRTIESVPATDGAIAVITGNIPEGATAEIEVVELSEEQLIEYFGEEKATAMIGFVSYDITIWMNGEEWQPDESVSVVIKHPDIQVSEGENLSLAHVDSMTQEVSEVEPMLKDNRDIEFQAEGFSLYIAYTVDFHYGELTFSIAGESEILLSDLFVVLNIEKNVDDVTAVDFTDYELIEVKAVYAEDGVTVVDWKLISLKAFTSEEKLTITFADSEKLEIKVTDAEGDPVWAYHASDLTTPYAKYATVRLAVTNTALRDNDILELHADVAETVSAVTIISKTVSIRSENSFTHTWSFPNIQQNTYGIRVSGDGKTVTIGGGTGEGALIVDNGGTGGFAQVLYGTLVLDNRLVVRNFATSGSGGGPLLLSYTNGHNAPVLRINGGVFKNNQSLGATSSRDGGFITNMNGIIYLNGGSFEGNEAITGKGNAIYQNGELHLSGAPYFDDDQDIYIVCTNDANHLSGSEHALIKDASIESASIPLTIGTQISSLYDGRNILTSTAAAQVNEDDAELFVVLNEEDLNTYYKKLGYIAKDAGKGNPVIELVPNFVENFDNFINDNYTFPIEQEAPRTKTAHWLDDEKSQAEIVINEDSNKVEGPILVIGPLCGAHALNGNSIAEVINKLADYNDVEYYFQSATAASKNMFDQGIAGVIRGPVSGTVNRGGTINGNIFGANGNLYSGAHNSGGYMARKLQEVLQQKQYSNIVLLFDNFCITSYSYYAFTPEEQVAFYQAANLLKPYYDNNQVLWISSANHVVGVDYETQESVSEEIMTDLLGRGCYSDNENHYHYDETHTANNAASIAKFDKFNNFFNMALFDPATWLNGVWSGRIPAWEEYDVDNPGVLYSQASQITDYINVWVHRDEMRIVDTVDPKLPINHVIIEVSHDNGNTWIDITENSGVSVDINGQDVLCTITDEEYFYTNLRMRIICDCPGEFKTEQDEPKDTNVGEATIDYYYHDVLNESHPLVSPKLYKAFPAMTVTKQFEGIPLDQIAVLANDFCITIANAETEEIVAKLSILSDPDEGMIAPDSVSVDGMKYTWKVTLPDGDYSLSESGADLPGYIRASNGLGAITVNRSGSSSGDVVIDISNKYSSGYVLPNTGGIGVYPIYTLGVLLVAGSIVYGCRLRRKRERRAE